MNDSKDNQSVGSYVEPALPTNSRQIKFIGKHHPKKLDSFYDDHSIDVCLRIKPPMSSIPTELDTLTILNSTTVACNNGHARDDVTEYKFSSIFGPNIDQMTFFNSWVYNKISRFLNGNNELLFAYGTTNAGKTYTIHGNVTDPGIIPRALLLIFNSLNPKLMSRCKYKPDKVMAAHILDENLMEHEENIRNKILNNLTVEKTQDELKSFKLHIDDGQTIHSVDQLTSNSIAEMFALLQNDKKVVLDHGDVCYTVWVTFSEIYNESIYDLLVTYSPNQKRIPLKLSLDYNKSVYVKDLTHIFVQSAEEAYKIITFGRNNLKIASNTLNASSSRSHCIFTLKLMRVKNVEDPDMALISSISFCDLAGSERLKKTMNVGDRLIESKNINTSLLVLNKCFSVLRDNQKRGENHLVPYRESKLTQMFQTALTSHNMRTGISMAVNVNMSPSLLEETKQVLNMSAIVRSITKIKKTVKPRPSFAIWATNNRKSTTFVKSSQNEISENEENINCTDSEKKSVIGNEDFEAILKEEKAKLRKELISQFSKILDNNETLHRNQKETMIKNKSEMYENKIKKLKAYYLEEIKEREDKLANLHSNPNLTNNYQNAMDKSERDNYEFRIGELEIAKEDLIAEINTLKNLQDMRQVEIDDKNIEIENFKTMLEEANNVYEKIESELNVLTDRCFDAYQQIEEKNLEIEMLTGSLDAKDNMISEMEAQQEELINEAAEQRVSKYMDEKLVEIVGLENTINKLQQKYKQCSEEKSELAKKYQNLKQNYLTMSKNLEVSNSSNITLTSKVSDQESKIADLLELIKKKEYKLKEHENKYNELQTKINHLTAANIKPKTTSVAVSTDPLPFTVFYEDQENEFTKSEQRPQRKCRAKTPGSIKKKKNVKKVLTDTPDKMCDEMLNEAIDKIPTSTRKRKLFDSKPPLSDSSNMPSDAMDCVLQKVLSPASVLQQFSKLRVKK